MHLTSDNKFKKSGLYLPPGVGEREKVQQGYVIKTGPGYAIPMPVDDEPWKHQDEQVKYIGDKYFIVPQSAILMLEREEDI